MHLSSWPGYNALAERVKAKASRLYDAGIGEVYAIDSAVNQELAKLGKTDDAELREQLKQEAKRS